MRKCKTEKELGTLMKLQRFFQMQTAHLRIIKSCFYDYYSFLGPDSLQSDIALSEKVRKEHQVTDSVSPLKES